MIVNVVVNKILKSGVLVIALFSVLSRLMGLWRDRVLATTFGASGTLDAYYTAFKLPDFIFTLLILGALSAALIPKYIEERETQGRDFALALARQVMYMLSAVILCLVVVAVILAPELIGLIAPGFSGERLQLSIALTRIMLWSTLAFTISNTLGSILQAEKKFLAFVAAPLFYNLGIIVGAYALVPYWGPRGLAIGVVAGSLMHLIVQAIPAYKLGFRLWPPVWSTEFNAAVSKFFVRLGGRIIGLAATALEQIIVGSFLSTLAIGSITAFALASNLQSFPTNVFGVSLAIASFPIFSELFSQKNEQRFLAHLTENIRKILFFILPLAILFLLLRAHIVRLVLGAGEFDWPSTIKTAEFLGYLAIAMLADSLLPLLARVFYALGNTKIPALTSLGAVALNTILMSWWLPWGIAGIGWAYIVARTLHLSALTYMLIVKMPEFKTKDLLNSIKPLALAAFMAGAATYGALHLLVPLVNLHSFGGVVVHAVLAGTVGLGTYFIFTNRWQVPEYALVINFKQGIVNFFKQF